MLFRSEFSEKRDCCELVEQPVRNAPAKYSAPANVWGPSGSFRKDRPMPDIQTALIAPRHRTFVHMFVLAGVCRKVSIGNVLLRDTQHAQEIAFTKLDALRPKDRVGCAGVKVEVRLRKGEKEVCTGKGYPGVTDRKLHVGCRQCVELSAIDCFQGRDRGFNKTMQPGKNRSAMPIDLGRTDRKSTRLNSSHIQKSRMPSSA